MKRSKGFFLRAVAALAVSSSVAFLSSKQFLQQIENTHDKLKVKQFIKANLNDSQRFLNAVEQLSAEDIRKLAAILTKMADLKGGKNLITTTHISEFQAAIQAK
ncbi:MAG: hypothetical protein LKF36_11795 [Lactobacillus sp.]|jgi:cytoplasmic iron level regulating protein YaaA (DUF328/UPF0246 family)|nr:hypothetical protein [Lactobacillus sp.]